MHASKPNLLQILTGELVPPQVVSKITAPFVDRDSVAAIGHVRILPRVGEFQGIPHPPNRANRIPDSDKMQGAMTAKCRFESLRHLKGMRHSSGIPGALRVEANHVGDQTIIAGT